MLGSTLLLLPVFAPVVLAVNDWSKPCFSGWCEYDSGNGVDSAYGSMTLSGPTNAISDITKAAGWHILECDPNSKEPQAIRMVCESDDEDASGCGHLDQGGAENTIIRLPESCGAGPFARVERTWFSEDQTVPESVSRKLKRATAPPVKAVKFDFDFNKVPAGKGPVALSASATNIRGEEQELGARALGRIFHKFSRRAAGDRRPLFRRGFISDVINRLKVVNKFDGSRRATLTPINVNKNFPLFNGAVSCPGLSGKVSMTVDAKVNAFVTFGYIMTGTIVPPKIDDLALYSALKADASATFNIDAAAQASVDSGSKDLFSVALPGLEFPGIITVGPSFTIAASVKASLGAVANLKVGASFDMPKIEMVFPPKQGSSNGVANAVKTPLNLALAPSASAAGNLEAHLIPRVDLGVNILNGKGKATVFLNMDVSGKLAMSVKGAASASKSIAAPAAKGAKKPAKRAAAKPVKAAPKPKPAAKKPAAKAPTPKKSAAKAPAPKPKAPAAKPAAKKPATAAPKAPPKPKTPTKPKAVAKPKATPAVKKPAPTKAAAGKKTATPKCGRQAGAACPFTPGKAAAAPAKVDPATAKKAAAAKAADKGPSAFSGCVDMDAGVSVTAGASAVLAPFFDKSTSVKLLTKNAKLLHKCFGGAKRELSTPVPEFTITKRALTCPPSAGAIVQKLINQLV